MPETGSGLRYPSLGSATNVPQDLQNLATDIDQHVKTTVPNQAARLALAAEQGLLVVENDTKKLYIKTATGWDLVWAPKVNYASRPLLILQRTNFSVPSTTYGNWTRVTGWTTVHSSGSAVTVNAATGIITCQREGWLSMNGYASSDDSQPGRSGLRWRAPGALSAFPTEYLSDNRPRPSSPEYHAAGVLSQPMSWSGRVQSGETTHIDLQQDSTDHAAIPYSVYLALEYQNDFSS